MVGYSLSVLRKQIRGKNLETHLVLKKKKTMRAFTAAAVRSSEIVGNSINII